MDTAEFEKLKKEIDEKKLQMAQAKGKQEAIVEQWKKDYGFTTVEEAEKKLAEIEKDNAEKTAKRDEYFEKLKNAVDWNKV